MEHDEAGAEMGLRRVDRGTHLVAGAEREAAAAARDERPLTLLVRPDEGPSERSSAALKSYVWVGVLLALLRGVHGRLGEGALLYV
jgi:hypothetical protein